MPEEKQEDKFIKNDDMVIMDDAHVCGLTKKQNLNLKEYKDYKYADLQMILSNRSVYFKKEDKTTYSEEAILRCIKAWNVYNGFGNSKSRLDDTLHNSVYHYRKEMPLVIQLDGEGDTCIIIAPRISNEGE